MTVFDMDRGEFLEVLSEKTTPQEIFDNAPNIYEYMGELFDESCGDSVLREWAFEWWSEETGEDYDKIYDRWLNEF